MSYIDFSAQETRSYGRQLRQPVPTRRIQTYNQMQTEKENRRLAKATKNHSKSGTTPVGSRPKPRPLNLTAAQNSAPRQQASGSAPASILASAPSTAHPSHPQPPAGGLSRPDSPRMELPPSGLRMATPGEDAAAYARTQLPQELEPHDDIDGLSAEERFEIQQDPDADPASDGEDDGSDEYNNHRAVVADRGLDASSPLITSTPVNLAESRRLVRRAVNYSSPAVLTPAPMVAYHTPTPTAPYATNPRGLVRRTHVFVAAANSPDPRSSPTPLPSKRNISDVDGARDERDDLHYDDTNDTETFTVLRASDLPPARRRLLDVAVRHFRLLIISEGPHADGILQHQLATTAWFSGQKELRRTHGYEGVTAPTHDELALLKARSHQVKGDIKIIAREVIIGKKGYDFRDDNTPEVIAHNRQLVTTLLTNNGFLYTDPTNRDIPGSLYEHTALQEVLNRTFYNNESDSEAIMTSEYFANGLPLKALAYFSSALECVISERATGERIKCRMSAKTWRPKYEKHLKILEDWKVYTTNSGSRLTEKLQIRMIQDARHYAQADVTPTGFEDAGLSTDDFAKNDV
ncbi:hypothetical protein DFH08DRAFT_1086778 [Mycena albidolilacea]|uniref:DUF6532 domain-containing protein n=1 Tax=Mycena albidolilacea TaxID=1033008 RepID=A0AAD7EE71_9AGAR|nr:hypothetical protein DFH08DRAFT_1086778 [Mycena albidolilacea]